MSVYREEVFQVFLRIANNLKFDSETRFKRRILLVANRVAELSACKIDV